MIFDGKYKALTFSFDDGNVDDVRLVGLLNRYGLKATFNLNSGILSQGEGWLYNGEKVVQHANYYEYPNLYEGHEIASHSYTHPHLEELDEASVDNQIRMDKELLRFLYGRTPRGMAYPFGTYNQTVLEVLKKYGIEYSRTVQSTYGFDWPENLLEWHPTCHFRDQRVDELTERFLGDETHIPRIFYIWGHSYELVTERDWEKFEQFCVRLSQREDICYCTNIEAVDWMGKYFLN